MRCCAARPCKRRSSSWRPATEPAETAARENLWRAVQVLGDVRRHLHSAVTDGKIAQGELDRLAGLNRLRQ